MFRLAGNAGGHLLLSYQYYLLNWYKTFWESPFGGTNAFAQPNYNSITQNAAGKFGSA